MAPSPHTTQGMSLPLSQSSGSLLFHLYIFNFFFLRVPLVWSLSTIRDYSVIYCGYAFCGILEVKSSAICQPEQTAKHPGTLERLAQFQSPGQSKILYRSDSCAPIMLLFGLELVGPPRHCMVDPGMPPHHWEPYETAALNQSTRPGRVI